MSEELELQQDLSTGAQLGIAAFFAGLPFLAMGVEAIGWGETGLVLAAVGAGSLGLGTKLLIDSHQGGDAASDDDEQGNSFLTRLALATGLDRLQHADWSVLLRPVGAPAPLSYPKKERARIGQPDDNAPAPTKENDVFMLPRLDDTGGIARLTIEQIVSHCQPNSYNIFIGRSLTKPGNKAVLINIYKQHFRFTGASQRGKSSMVAAFLDIVTRTHDPKHVRLVLLDKEDQTSNLFAHLPHMATARGEDGKVFKLHARNADQVLEYLVYTAAIMEYRYTLSKEQLFNQPIVLVYIEEFLDLKNDFKRRIDRAKGDQAKEQARRDYATLVYCIEVLSQRGLKARVQLLLCAQVEYADDDFKESMANIACGFSFCVRPTAAKAAGFRNNALLQKNAEDNKVGQAVVETPDCNDLVLAPDYDLEARILTFERDHPDIHPIHHSPDEPLSEHENEEVNQKNVNPVNAVEPLEKTVNASVNGGERSTQSNNVPPPFTQAQEVQVLLAYHELSSSGEKLTRTALRDYLRWNSKQYQFILKPICDKHGILMD